MRICPLCGDEMEALGVVSEIAQTYQKRGYIGFSRLETKYCYCLKCLENLPIECNEEWFDEEVKEEK